MSDLRYAFHLSPVYAGINGMRCEECQQRTYSIWLAENELQWLPPAKNIASLVICERKLGRVWCVSCAQSKGRIAEYETIADANVAEMIGRIEELERSAEFRKQWWAERYERLKELAQSNGTWPQVAAIIANGTVDSMETPTYAQLLNSAKHEAERLAKEIAELRDRLSGRESICTRCGLRQSGDSQDAGF